jgi:dolichol-phosphate mannosyltransferase
MSIGIVIPAFNENRQVFDLIKLINKNLKIKYILIIDDTKNSKIKNISLYFNNIIYINRKKKLGRGSAIIYGIKFLMKKNVNIIIEMDADFSHNPNEIKKNLELFKKNKIDLLISSRYLNKSKIINWPLKRKIFSKCSNYLAKILLNIPITDFTNGFRIYSKNTFNIITKNCGKIGDGFIVLSEIIYEIYKNNLKISETHTRFKNRIRGESSVNAKLIFDSLIGLMRICLKKLANHKNN